jgi:hypothetical protein
MKPLTLKTLAASALVSALSPTLRTMDQQVYRQPQAQLRQDNDPFPFTTAYGPVSEYYAHLHFSSCLDFATDLSIAIDAAESLPADTSFKARPLNPAEEAIKDYYEMLTLRAKADRDLCELTLGHGA